MADAITAVKLQPTLVAATTDSSSLTLDPDWSYELIHTGLDVSKAAELDEIFLANNATAVATFAASTNKAVLQYIANQGGVPVQVGPGTTILQYISASLATFQVIPLKKHNREW